MLLLLVMAAAKESSFVELQQKLLKGRRYTLLFVGINFDVIWKVNLLTSLTRIL